MKKWTLILALILCLIAVGGLAVLFRAETPNDTTGGQNSSVEFPTDDTGTSDGGGTTDDTPIDGIDLNETNLIF